MEDIDQQMPPSDGIMNPGLESACGITGHIDQYMTVFNIKQCLHNYNNLQSVV